MTVTSVKPPARFGYISSRNGLVTYFGEKNQSDTGWINGGFFVVNRRIKNYLMGDFEALEINPVSKLVKDGELMTHKHYGFWQPIDTLREKQILEKFSTMPQPPWLNFDV
jgi:glucose-1-phosphate cytidylyltransferase